MVQKKWSKKNGPKKMVQKEIVPKNGPKYTHYFSCHAPKGVNLNTGFAKGEAQIRHA